MRYFCFSVSGSVVAIRCHSVAYLSTAVPLLHLSSRFDSLRCLSVAVPIVASQRHSIAALCDACLLRCCAILCFAFPLRFCSMPIISIRFRCGACHCCAALFHFGAVRFLSIRFYSFANRVAAYLFRCSYLLAALSDFNIALDFVDSFYNVCYFGKH